MANTIGWGQGSVNNTNDWGKGKANSTNDWGSIYANSPSGETNIEGGSAINPFIIEVKTDFSGASNNDQFTLPWIGTYDVDWGDGNTETGLVDTQTHTYSSAGTYDISVTATTGRIFFNNVGDPGKLLDVKQWGSCEWTSFNYAFGGCGRLTGTYTDAPNLTNVTDLFRMFFNCANFQGELESWDTSGVTNMSGLLQQTDYNQPLNNLDTSAVLNMNQMFRNVDDFDQDISNWDVNQVTNLGNFMLGADPLSTANYDALLIGWDSQGAMSYSGTVNFGSSQYTPNGAAEAARTSLISKWGGIIDGGAVPQPFIIQVQTDNTGTSNNDQFTLPWIGTYDVDWGDGNTDTGVTNTQTHTYSTAGTYDVSVTATTGRIYFNNGGDKAKLLEIKQWGTCQWTNMLDAFEGCSSLTVLSATDTPDLSSVFLVAKFIKGTNLVSGNFDDWDITPLTSLSQMFNGATSFNSPLNSWDTSNVTNMYYAFGFASSFNQPINSWDTSGVTNMSSMFIGANSFNQPLDTWDVSNVTNMGFMFYLATSFNQPLDNWNVSQVANFTDFMRGVTLSTANYDALLIAWDAQGAMSYSGTVNFGGSTYTLGGAAEAARTSLISKWGGIVDGGGV